MSVRELVTGSWEVSVYLPGNRRDRNRRWRRIYPTEKIASDVDLKLRHARSTDTLRQVLEDLKGMSRFVGLLDDLFDRYWEEYVVVHNRHLKTKASRIKLLRSRFGRIPAEDLRPSDLSSFISWRKAKGLANTSINREISILKHVLNWAVDLGLIRFNPIARVKKLKELRKAPREDLELAIEKVFALLPATTKPVFTFILETGCRRGEALALRHDQVFLEEGLALVPLPKSGVPRYLAITDLAAEAIASVPPAPDCPFVFYNPDTLTRWHDCRKPWETARRNAGYSWLRIKDLRTAFAIRLSNTPGIEKHVIQTLLGHASITTTERFYAIHDQRLAVKRALRLLNRC